MGTDTVQGAIDRWQQEEVIVVRLLAGTDLDIPDYSVLHQKNSETLLAYMYENLQLCRTKWFEVFAKRCSGQVDATQK